MSLVVRIGCAVAVGVILSFHGVARASDGAVAEELFRQGQSLMGESRYDEACPKLAESQRLEPSTGTLLNLAVCHEKQGKLASAWNEFQEALVVARRDGRADRVRFAEEHIQAIEPNLSRLTITLPEESDVPGLEVVLDGTKIGRPALGVALPVDPGPHELVVSAPDKAPWKTTVDVPEGPGSQSVPIPVLSDAPKQAEQPGATSDAADPQAKDGSTQRYIAYGAGGLGLVGLALGTVFGIDALGKFDESNESGCNEQNECNAAGAELRDAARTSGNVSTAAFVAGGVLLGGAVVLYLTAPSGSAEAAPAAARDRGPVWTAKVRPTFAGAAIEMGATW